MRMKVLSACTFTYSGETCTGTLHDISLCGALVLSPREVEVGTKVQLDFSLPEANEPIRVNGRSVRLLNNNSHLGPGFGIDFTVLAINHREAIDHYVRTTFRHFRRLQFELSKFEIDWTVVNDLLRHTYLSPRTYSADVLRNLVTLELDSFRLRKVASGSSTG